MQRQLGLRLWISERIFRIRFQPMQAGFRNLREQNWERYRRVQQPVWSSVRL